MLESLKDPKIFIKHLYNAEIVFKMINPPEKDLEPLYAGLSIQYTPMCIGTTFLSNITINLRVVLFDSSTIFYKKGRYLYPVSSVEQVGKPIGTIDIL